MKPHKHAELIKAWADGAEIESFVKGNGWIEVKKPLWNESAEYRIKPEEKKPVVRWLWADCNNFITQQFFSIEEIDQKFPPRTMRQLVFTRTEFPE